MSYDYNTYNPNTGAYLKEIYELGLSKSIEQNNTFTHIEAADKNSQELIVSKMNELFSKLKLSEETKITRTSIDGSFGINNETGELVIEKKNRYFVTILFDQGEKKQVTPFNGETPDERKICISKLSVDNPKDSTLKEYSSSQHQNLPIAPEVDDLMRHLSREGLTLYILPGSNQEEKVLLRTENLIRITWQGLTILNINKSN